MKRPGAKRVVRLRATGTGGLELDLSVTMTFPLATLASEPDRARRALIKRLMLALDDCPGLSVSLSDIRQG